MGDTTADGGLPNALLQHVEQRTMPTSRGYRVAPDALGIVDEPLPPGTYRTGAGSARLQALMTEIGLRLESLCAQLPPAEFAALVRRAAVTTEYWEERTARLGAPETRRAAITPFRNAASELRLTARNTAADARRTCAAARMARMKCIERRLGITAGR